MISDDSPSLKHIMLKILLFCSVLIGAYILFIAFISVWLGLRHTAHPGYWMPIFVGALAVMITLCLLWRLFRFVLTHLKEKDYR